MGMLIAELKASQTDFVQNGQNRQNRSLPSRRVFQQAVKGFLVVLFCLIALAMFVGTTHHSSNPEPRPARVEPVVSAYKDTPESLEIERVARVEYAKRFDQQMLDAGIESTTVANGPKNTTLYIKYALAGRATANALGEKLDFDELKTYGFKKVYFTNGFEGEMHVGVTWKVE